MLRVIRVLGDGKFVKSFLQNCNHFKFLQVNFLLHEHRSLLSPGQQSTSFSNCGKFSQKLQKYDVKNETLHLNENNKVTFNEQLNLEQENIEKNVNTVADTEDDDSYGSALLDYYVKKAKEDIDNMDDVDYHDIQNVNHRVFFKIVDLWLKEVGSTKRGHREFIRTLLNSLRRFKVEAEISAYLKLLDCFPDGKHTGLKRESWFKAAFQDRIADHTLGVHIMIEIFYNAVPNDKLFNKTYDLFGRFSPVTWHARRLIFWYPKFVGPDPHPVSNSDFKKMTAVDIALHGIRQMNPGIKSHYHHFAVDRTKCDEKLDAVKIDSVISVQTDEQINSLANHDPAMPIFIEGPYITYFKTKSVQYYVMRSDPKVPKLTSNVKQLTTKEWWVEFYGVDWETGRKPANKIEEKFFPTLDVGEPYNTKKIEEIAVVDKDTATVEGPVYALACTDYRSPEALLTWIRGLVPQNPVLRECSIVIREEDAFLLNAPKTDPNESFYEAVELPQPFE